MVLFKRNGETFRYYENCMKVFGVWPLDSNQRRSTIVFLITLLPQIVIVLMGLIHPLGNCLPINIQNAKERRIEVILVGILLQITFRVYGRKMILLVESTTKDWSSVIDLEECDIMERHNKSGLFIFCAQGVISCLTATISSFRSLAFIDKVPLLDSCEFHDYLVWVNVSISVLSIIASYFGILVIYCGLALFWSFAMHLSGQYKILKKQFKDFLHIKEKETSRQEFRRLVQRHNQLLELSGYLENSFGVFVGFNVIITQITCCVIAYQQSASTEEFNSTSSIGRCLVMSLILMKLYMFYYAGDYLTACSEEIGEVFTQCNWYDLSKKSITDFSIVIARCQMPKKTLTCAKMYKLNLSNFKFVLNALYSYISCVVAVTENKDK